MIAAQTDWNTVEWTTADPVTGTTGKFSYLDGSNYSNTEEHEPFGQWITKNDPAEPPQPPPSDPGPIGGADDPQWQCSKDLEGFWGGFSGMPFHCQYATKDSPSWKVVLIEKNPKRVSEYIDSPMPEIDVQRSTSDEILTYARESTAKQQDDKKPKKGRKKRKGKTVNQPKPLAVM